MAQNDNASKMKWQKDLDTFFPLYNTFLIDGYVDDEQPYVGDDGKKQYCSIEKYLEQTFGKDRCVVIYDPTEAEDMRFKICDEYVTVNEEEDQPADESADDMPPKVTREYDSDIAQHFWDIVTNENIGEQLIDHRRSGPTLDISRIHYAITERSERVALPPIFANALENISLGDGAKSYLFVVKRTSRLISRDRDSSGLSADELMLFRQLLGIAQAADKIKGDENRPPCKMIVLANKTQDLPIWFTDEIANPYIKTIHVDKPTEEDKLTFFDEMIEDGEGFTDEFLIQYEQMKSEADESKTRNAAQKKFLSYTNDFGVNMLRRYGEYIKAHKVDSVDRLGYSVSAFRAGEQVNPWDDETLKTEILNIKGYVSAKIKGQDQALTEAQNILTRAALGLDRAKNPNLPRVVLFLAGPTGTGKTELCKQIAEHVFGSAERMVRFDMSEYGQQESDQKLFGAPPGYVGYEEGGKLTNAIKKEPFSLILFDEIEKAHRSVLDKFLQILGDGRLTDGKGETVRFSDCIIVITSNAGVNKLTGMSQERIDTLMNGDKAPEGEMNIEEVARMESEGKSEDEIYRAVREHLRYNVKCYFHCVLQKPELYGRVANALVYYNYIGKDHVGPIAAATIDGTVRATKEMFGVSDIVCAGASDLGEVKAKIAATCTDNRIRALGARGIINQTESIFSTSLSNFLANEMKEGRIGSLDGATLVCKCADAVDGFDDITWEIFG